MHGTGKGAAGENQKLVASIGFRRDVPAKIERFSAVFAFQALVCVSEFSVAVGKFLPVVDTILTCGPVLFLVLAYEVRFFCSAGEEFVFIPHTPTLVAILVDVLVVRPRLEVPRVNLGEINLLGFDQEVLVEVAWWIEYCIIRIDLCDHRCLVRPRVLEVYDNNGQGVCFGLPKDA